MQHTTETNKKTSNRDQNEVVDIVEFILEDHKPLKELIKVMKDSEKHSIEERLKAFKEFAPTLIAHAKPEEETLYTYLKKVDDLREHGFEGDVEHSIADQLVEEIKRTKDEDQLSARIKVLAELVEHHIEEEESEILPDFKDKAGDKIKSQLGNQFLELKVKYLAAGDDNVIPDPKKDKESRDMHH